MGDCHCIIRHPADDAERTALMERLKECHAIKDTQGVAILTLQLTTRCDSDREPLPGLGPTHYESYVQDNGLCPAGNTGSVGNLTGNPTLVTCPECREKLGEEEEEDAFIDMDAYEMDQEYQREND